ncbi:hypothetical protein JCGZ_03017 [Jatropha curcas]|uniref:Uncharacterized protein n=1 Tax=Jatropha curcas TaxID=180498 RepID=A0A067LCD2_JATCU|nr:hypothetical protein JCGZ_03017 [Jatropha curcas]
MIIVIGALITTIALALNFSQFGKLEGNSNLVDLKMCVNMDLYDAPSSEFIASTCEDSEEDLEEETNEDDVVDEMERTSTEPSTTTVVTNQMLLEHLI